MRQRLAFYGVALAVLVLDQAAKAWASSALAGGRVIHVVSDVLILNLVHNVGSAFGLIRSGAIPLALIAVAAVAVMVFIERRGFPGNAMAVAVGLLLGGAVGNLVDRVRFRYVVDFIELDWHGRNVFPVFNAADSAITIGTIILVAVLWRTENTAKNESGE